MTALHMLRLSSPTCKGYREQKENSICGSHERRITNDHDNKLPTSTKDCKLWQLAGNC